MSTETRETLAQLLTAAADFADHEWTQGAYARNNQGHQIPYAHPRAIRFCASGHLMKARHENPAAAAQVSGLRLLQAVLQEIPGERDLMTWNDQPERRAAEVRQLFRQAAARQAARN